MEQFQYSLFIIGNSHVGDIQTRNIGCNSYNIAILYPAKTFVGKFGFGDVMECLSGKGFSILSILLTFSGEDANCLYDLGCEDMKLRDSAIESGLLAAVTSSIKPCLTPLFIQSAM